MLPYKKPPPPASRRTAAGRMVGGGHRMPGGISRIPSIYIGLQKNGETAAPLTVDRPSPRASPVPLPRSYVGYGFRKRGFVSCRERLPGGRFPGAWEENPAGGRILLTGVSPMTQ